MSARFFRAYLKVKEKANDTFAYFGAFGPDLGLRSRVRFLLEILFWALLLAARHCG